MKLVSSSSSKSARKRNTINVLIEEYPKRPLYDFKSEREMTKFIKKVESIIRSSIEYKEYIRFLKDNMNMNKCAVLKNIINGEGKKYSIEVHHEPFGLFEITMIVLASHQDKGWDINPYKIANEVMELHYEGLVGLIPLSSTQHDLVHSGKIFIPLQQIYQDYSGFVEKYEDVIPEKIKELIEFKVNMSLKCSEFQSDVLEPEFIYIDIDGFDFPNVPDEWGVRKSVLEEAIKNPDESTQSQVFRIGDEI